MKIKNFEQFFEGKKEQTVKFQDWDCIVSKENYADNDRIALELIDKHNGELVAVATINVPDEDLKDDEAVIKDYSENEGMLDALVKAKIVSKPLRYVETGMVDSPVVKVLI